MYLELVSKELNHFGGLRRFFRRLGAGDTDRFTRHLSVSRGPISEKRRDPPKWFNSLDTNSICTSKYSVHNWPFAASYVRFYEICTILHVNGHFLTVLALILTALVHWAQDSHVDSGSYYWYTHLPSETLHILSRLRNFKPFRPNSIYS